MYIEAKHDRASRIEKPQPWDHDYYYYVITPAMNKLSSSTKLTVAAHAEDSRVRHERRLSSGAKLTAAERGQDPSQASEVISHSTCKLAPDQLWIRKAKDAIHIASVAISQMAEMLWSST